MPHPVNFLVTTGDKACLAKPEARCQLKAVNVLQRSLSLSVRKARAKNQDNGDAASGTTPRSSGGGVCGGKGEGKESENTTIGLCRGH